MSIRTTLIALAIGTLALANGRIEASESNNDDIAQLIATDKRMQRAFVDRDVRVLNQILTDDYVLVGSRGNEETKADVIGEVESGAITWQINETSDLEVRAHGDTGVVVAILHSKGVSQGKAFDVRVKFSDVYIRDHGSWRNMHAHTCIIIPA